MKPPYVGVKETNDAFVCIENAWRNRFGSSKRQELRCKGEFHTPTADRGILVGSVAKEAFFTFVWEKVDILLVLDKMKRGGRQQRNRQCSNANSRADEFFWFGADNFCDPLLLLAHDIPCTKSVVMRTNPHSRSMIMLRGGRCIDLWLRTILVTTQNKGGHDFGIGILFLRARKGRQKANCWPITQATCAAPNCNIIIANAWSKEQHLPSLLQICCS